MDAKHKIWKIESEIDAKEEEVPWFSKGVPEAV